MNVLSQECTTGAGWYVFEVDVSVGDVVGKVGGDGLVGDEPVGAVGLKDVFKGIPVGDVEYFGAKGFHCVFDGVIGRWVVDDKKEGLADVFGSWG